MKVNMREDVTFPNRRNCLVFSFSPELFTSRVKCALPEITTFSTLLPQPRLSEPSDFVLVGLAVFLYAVPRLLQL
ncbi:unnamed protein product [Lasius platythorax]|uniref:Uncharacterized protein n=1 Tax=Lasius platythorax TaxID=488582 RepID=A0AAV2NXI3_9HYME